MNKIITTKIKDLLNRKKLSGSKLGKLIGMTDGAVYSMINGERAFSPSFIQKIAPILEVSPEEIKSWIIADKYSRETLQRAIELKREYVGQDKLIFTIKMHELMGRHNLTINPFSRVIGYNQGWLSQVVLGKEPVSKKLMQKLCVFSGLPEDEITSWVVADKYSADTLRKALEC